jgi:PhnB protein
VTPYLIVSGAAQALDYYKMAFDAKEIMRMPSPDGKIMHAEMQIGTSRIMLADEMPQMGQSSPQTLGGSGVGLMLYVTDVDDTFQRAVSGGGKAVRPVINQFYGDRTGTIADPFGHQWTIATHVEDVSEAEMQRRAQEAMKSMAG